MDTISRENNSYLPIAAVIVGVLALALAGVALGKLATANKKIDGLTESMTKIDTVETEVRSATTAAEQAKASADRANTGVSSLQAGTQRGFDGVAQELGKLGAEVAKLQAPPPKAVSAKGEKADKGPVVAGPDEYVIKAGDNGSKIAKAHGATLADLQAVNPGVDLAKVKIGQKIKLPAKK